MQVKGSAKSYADAAFFSSSVAVFFVDFNTPKRSGRFMLAESLRKAHGWGRFKIELPKTNVSDGRRPYWAYVNPKAQIDADTVCKECLKASCAYGFDFARVSLYPPRPTPQEAGMLAPPRKNYESASREELRRELENTKEIQSIIERMARVNRCTYALRLAGEMS